MVTQSQTWKLSFHGTQYIISAEVSDCTLGIDIEQDDAPSTRWSGEFSSSYIEDITAKTGNFKKFSTFTKMLFTALGKGSDAVFVDLLTYSDLEVLRARKMGQKGGDRAKPKASLGTSNAKRYLILTYAAEFDRAHYPLPLSFVASPTISSLQRTIERLRDELRVAQTHAFHGKHESHSLDRTSDLTDQQQARIDELEEENRSLHLRLEAVANSHHMEGRLEDQVQEMSDAYEQLRQDYDTIKAKSTAEMRRLKQECRAANARLRELKQLEQVEEELQQRESAQRRRADRLEATVEELKANHRRSEAALNRELSKAKKALTEESQTTLELRAKVRELNRRLVAAERGSGKAVARKSTPTRGRSNGLHRRTTAASRSRASSNDEGKRGGASRKSSSGYHSAGGYSSGGSVRSTGSRRNRRSDSPRFDPTAYQKEKERKRQEAEQRRKRAQRRARSGSRDSGYSSAGSNASARSARSNGSARSTGSARSHGSARSQNSNRSHTRRAKRQPATKKGHTAAAGVPKARRSTGGEGRRAIPPRPVLSQDLYEPSFERPSRAPPRAPVVDSSISSTGNNTWFESRHLTEEDGELLAEELPQPPAIHRSPVPDGEGASHSDALALLERSPMKGPPSYLSSPQVVSTETSAAAEPRSVADATPRDASMLDSMPASFDSTNDEISEIDRRLSKLQDFLRQAKEKRGAT